MKGGITTNWRECKYSEEYLLNSLLRSEFGH